MAVFYNADFPDSLFLTIRLYRSWLLAGLPGSIMYPYRAMIDKFLVVQHLLVRERGSIG